MVVIGADLHKRSHTLVAVDDAGRKLAEKTVGATRPGHLEIRRWASQWPERSFALEDCRHLSRALERDLLIAGERVIRVPPKLMAGARRSSREPGKSDPIDALAVARAALREPDCRWPRSTVPNGTSACWSTTGTTWCAVAPRIRTACAGISTNS